MHRDSSFATSQTAGSQYMKSTFLQICVLIFMSACSGLTCADDQSGKSKLEYGAKIGPCLQFAPGPGSRVNIVNSCNECRTAIMSWCDGSIRRASVPAYGSIQIQTCGGTITLSTDIPCGNAIADFGQDKGLSPLTSSCSAHNDVGGTCSISCPDGKAASCSNGTGASSPVCECR